jgi:hypothetical protein
MKILKKFKEAISPKNGKLVVKENEKNIEVSSEIIDAELDVIECVFENDGCVQIKTEDYAFITLSLENIRTLEKLIIESEILFEKRYREKYK